VRIALIGPVYPYKGGISHYTGLLCKTLREHHQTFMYSFKFQYPKFLFRREQKDARDDSFVVSDTEYILHTMNPLNWITSGAQIKKQKFDAVILQWWHPYFAPCYFVLLKLLRKHRIIFVCHNVFPHERFPLDRFLAKLILRYGNGFIVHTKLDEKDLLSVKPTANYLLSPHPTYNIFKFENIEKEAARKLLCINTTTPVILFFGFVRDYKGLKHLLKALPYVKEELINIDLWVVGDFADGKQLYLDLIYNLGIRDNIHIVDEYVSNRDVEKYFSAADLVILPYESATGSGIIQIAYGFEKPVVVTNVGGLPDVVEEGKTGFIVEPEKPELLAKAVLRFFAEVEKRPNEFREYIKVLNDKFSWERMADKIVALIGAK